MVTLNDKHREEEALSGDTVHFHKFLAFSAYLLPTFIQDQDWFGSSDILNTQFVMLRRNKYFNSFLYIYSLCSISCFWDSDIFWMNKCI